MSVPRACRPCRAAKAKCDFSRPACGRCQARRLECVGLPPDERFIFLDENERAQRNSERARRERGPAWSPLSFEVVSILHPVERAQTATLAQVDIIPAALSGDHEDQAIDYFLDAWTLSPGNLNDGLSPGHIHGLRALYVSAPSGSILWHAVRAMAFAGMMHHSLEDIPFTTMALRHYGSALQHLQSIVENAQLLTDDCVLAAMLLIDSFESLYLGRPDPFGPHFDAVMHVLNARSDEQFFEHGFCSLECGPPSPLSRGRTRCGLAAV